MSPTEKLQEIAIISGLPSGTVEFARNDDEGAWHLLVNHMFAVYSPNPSFGARCVPALKSASTSEEAIDAIYAHWCAVLEAH